MKKQILALLLSAAVVHSAVPYHASAAVAAQTKTAVIVKSVSFREGPSIGADRIRYLKAGEKLVVLDKPNKYWYKAKDSRGTIGYVSTSPTYITTEKTYPSKTDRAADIESVISAGMKYLGTPYEYASSRYDTKTFDCSDFVRQAFLEGSGLKLPADSRGQAAFVKDKGQIRTDWRQLKRGDLMFFMSYKGYKPSDYTGFDKQAQTVTHVGIYLGNGQVLHTYSVTSGGVKISSIAGTAWEYRFLFGGSAL